MASASLADDTIPFADRPGIRLVLKPGSVPPSGFVDGGWWPRSRDLPAELPALLDALAPRIGRVEHIGYRLQDWDRAAGRVVVDGTTVRLGGFRSGPADTLDVTADAHRLTLLVVPPDTDPDTADRAVRAAGHPGNTDDTASLLDRPAAR
ncbi:DUF5994 family protein [Pseudonocardia lacus]|uniref:DUF5994 family protein n=1 Tax=Pseudonocardia lacus TaxID=2835865 RepID=UPI001BDBE8CB|nr:DUF5994 family protein [Pseudonocardia lacus]